MKTICEKCGKELSFFDRKQDIHNERLGIHHDVLCKDCATILNGALALMDDMNNHIIGVLRERYNMTNMAAADLDLLIYLAIEAIYTYAPDFSSLQSPLQAGLICRGEYQATPEEDLCILVDKIIDYGFSLNKKNAQIIDLKGYFKRNTLYQVQVGLNAKEEIPKSYYTMILTSRGIVASHMETGECLTMPLEEHEEIVYSILNHRDIVLESMTYAEIPEQQPILFSISEQQCDAIKGMLDQRNEIVRRRIENRRRNLITLVTRKTFIDLKQICRDGNYSSIPLDCLLIFIVKNMMEDPEGRRTALYGEDSPILDILFESFYNNLILFGRTERKDLLEYMMKNTLLSEGFYVQYKQHRKEKAWAFFTTMGYMVCFLRSRKYVFVFENEFPNDIYYPCNDCIYQGCRYLQLVDRSESDQDDQPFQELDGLIFFSEDIDLIGKMNRFFNLNNIFYVMDRFVEAEERVYMDRASALEVKRVSDKLFGEFSFLPFCQYDEWAAICEKMKEDDFLLCQLIDQKNGGKKRSPITPTSYTVRIMRSFGYCAKELNKTLRFGDLSIAKAILWGYFNVSLVDTLSKEWIRVAGDVINDDDSLESAFAKYFAIPDIESDKSYYMGLFVYYLMSKEILPAEDFLENYERCIALYKNWNNGIETEATDDDAEMETQEERIPVEAEAVPENEEATSVVEPETAEPVIEAEEVESDPATTKVSDASEEDSMSVIDAEPVSLETESSEESQLSLLDGLIHSETASKAEEQIEE